MKSLSNDGTGSNNGNWLGFSLSSHSNPSSVSSSLAPSSFSHAAAATINYPSAIYYGLEGENAGLLSSLSVMPLKSDGSLCIMESFNRSHPQGFYPNLELFLLYFFLSFWLFVWLSSWNLSGFHFD